MLNLGLVRCKITYNGNENGWDRFGWLWVNLEWKVPSILKSTTFFYNVPNAIKAAILNSMPFAEGTLPVSDDESSYHEDASENGTATNKPKQQQQLIPTTTTISNIKLPILKKEEYDIWAMEMEPTWNILDKIILPPVSTVEIHVVEKERKARTILLIAIPHRNILRRFHEWTMQRKLGSYKWTEQEIISTSKSSANAQNVAFVSHSESNTNKVKFGHIGAYNNCTPTSSNNIQEREVPAGFADEVIYSLFAKQYEDLDLLHKDLEQIDDVDIEEMDINWQIAMIAIRMKKFYKKTGRRVQID
ncbi:hypothetical protein Tco_1019604 [Tanacetum coccineum]|uniref:Uncharacterized protein n=1 Tax=Tanacetum coccineum TaxID=301880 RepID=A0ABQ5FXT8_9ASTR